MNGLSAWLPLRAIVSKVVNNFQVVPKGINAVVEDLAVECEGYYMEEHLLYAENEREEKEESDSLVRLSDQG